MAPDEKDSKPVHREQGGVPVKESPPRPPPPPPPTEKKG